ncbi:hypothetical protein, partial [Sphingomonas sp. CCH9-H8]|uniref:hypothetical protein n=1 Tax=Sphingomonas sp. CCH9-H8 TaxID=1768772 RepID=UPI001E5851C4
MKRTAALVSLSLLLGAAAPPPGQHRPHRPSPPRADNDSPVRCKMGSGGYRPGSAMPQRHYLAQPPAPPPPP